MNVSKEQKRAKRADLFIEVFLFVLFAGFFFGLGFAFGWWAGGGR